MRVLYVSKASRVAAHREKLRVLAERVQVTLVTPERWGDAPWEPAPFDEELDVVRLPALLHGHNHLHVYRRLGGAVEAGKFDLLHVDEEPYSMATLQAARLARRRGLPSVFFAWQNLDKSLPPPFGALRRRVYRCTSGGIAGTAEAAQVLRSSGFDGRLLVSPQMGVSTERFRPDGAARSDRRRELGLEEDTFLVGFVGRLVEEKGVDVPVRALASLPECHLVLVGDGPERETLRRLAEGAGVGSRVHAVGGVPSLDVPGWTAALDVLVLPSRTTAGWKEQFGRAVVEAMACEVPVVVSDSGALPEVVGDAGRVVPEGSVEALADAVKLLVENEAERRGLGRRGGERVRERFTDERVVDDQVAFYRRVLAGTAGDPAVEASPAAGPDGSRTRGGST